MEREPRRNAHDRGLQRADPDGSPIDWRFGVCRAFRQSCSVFPECSLQQKSPALLEEGLQRGGVEAIVSVQLAAVESDLGINQCLILDDERRDPVPVEPALGNLADVAPDIWLRSAGTASSFDRSGFDDVVQADQRIQCWTGRVPAEAPRLPGPSTPIASLKS